MHSDNKEILKSVIKFMQMMLKCKWLKPFLPTTIPPLLSLPPQLAGALRRQVGVLLERIIKKHGYESIRELVPHNQQKFVTYINKQVKRANRGKEKEKEKSEKLKSLSKQDIESDEEDFEDKEDVFAKPKPLMDQWVLEEGDEPVDFLSSDSLTKLRSVVPKRESKKDEEAFPLKEGKLVIEDPEEKGEGEDSLEEEVDGEDDAMSFRQMKLFGKSGSKRKLTGEEERTRERLEEQMSSRKRRKGPGGSDLLTGQRYKSKKAGGDVMKGKYDPFAYVRFDPTALNKRNKNKPSRFSEVMGKAAKRGAKKGNEYFRKKKAQKKHK